MNLEERRDLVPAEAPVAERTRLVTVQGPVQLLNVLALLYEEREREPSMRSHDVLVVHGLLSADETRLRNAIQMLSRVWDWGSVVSLVEVPGGELADENEIYRQIGHSEVEVVYAARNWQSSNVAILRAFPSARKVLYGDGLGVVDSYLWSALPKFDEARLILPVEVESGFLDRVPFSVVDRRHLLDVLSDARLLSVEIRACVSMLAEWTAGGGVLVLPVNGTESGLIDSLEQEISLYVGQIVGLVGAGERVVIKPHPREANGQSRLLKQVLEEKYAIPAFLVDGDMAALPIEVLYPDRSSPQVLSVLSSAFVSLKYLYGARCVIGERQSILSGVAVEKRADVASYMNFLTDVSDRLDVWDGTSVIHRAPIISERDRRLVLVAIDAVNEGRSEEALVLFERVLRGNRDMLQAEFGRALALLNLGKLIVPMLVFRKLRKTRYAPLVSITVSEHPLLQRVRRWIATSRRRLGLARARSIG